MAGPYVARVYMNSEQKRLLVEFMEHHRDFATNRINSNYPSQLRNELWQELTNILNAEQMGVAKGAEGWKKSWKELKASVKEKVAKMKTCSERRGSKRPRAVPLTPLEERVLNLLGIPLPNLNKYSPESGSEEQRDISERHGQVLPYRTPLARTKDHFNQTLPCSSHLQVAESCSQLVETPGIIEEALPVIDECFQRSFHKQERSPSPYMEPEVTHPEVQGMYYENEEIEQEHEELQGDKESAYARLAAAQEELVALKRVRYQQKKHHEDAMLSVFKDFVLCVQNAFPPKG